MKMKMNQLAAQLYTVRAFTKTPADIAATLARVRRIGYPAVQVSAMGPIPEAELCRMLDGEGLVCCATHENGNLILDETEKVIDRLLALNCPYTAYPWPGGIDFSTRASVLDFARRLDVAGARMRRAGLTLTYHNHSHEFARVDGELILDVIYGHTGPDHLQGEIDTYWVHVGGGDPVAWCRKLAGRLPLLHLKDCVVTDGKERFGEVGQGVLNMPGIVAAAEESGCQWYIVEQDDCYGRDPFEALETSFRYLQTLARDGKPAAAERPAGSSAVLG